VRDIAQTNPTETARNPATAGPASLLTAVTACGLHAPGGHINPNTPTPTPDNTPAQPQDERQGPFLPFSPPTPPNPSVSHRKPLTTQNRRLPASGTGSGTAARRTTAAAAAPGHRPRLPFLSTALKCITQYKTSNGGGCSVIQ